MGVLDGRLEPHRCEGAEVGHLHDLAVRVFAPLAEPSLVPLILQVIVVPVTWLGGLCEEHGEFGRKEAFSHSLRIKTAKL
jgi:hypothetical protein